MIEEVIRVITSTKYHIFYICTHPVLQVANLLHLLLPLTASLKLH